MLLKQVVDIIEHTDSDHLSEALELFNENGIILGSLLPFLNVVLDKAPVPLCHKLKSIGFIGDIRLIQIKKNKDQRYYAVYDLTRFSHVKAKEWLERHIL